MKLLKQRGWKKGTDKGGHIKQRAKKIQSSKLMMQGNARGLGGGSENFQATSFCQYKDQCIVELGDVLNARAKLKYGALSHIITARILDSHPSEEQLRNLIDNPEHFDKLCAHIAEEVGGTRAGAGTNPQTDGAAMPKLPRSNSWSDLLLYERDGKIFF